MEFFFDPYAVEPDTSSEPRSFDPLPAGVYSVQITSAELKDTKSGGRRVALELTVAEGPYENRKLWDGINVVNASAPAQSLGHKLLAALCIAAGLRTMSHPDELIGRTVKVQTRIEPAKGDYKAQARIGSFIVPAAPAAKPAGAAGSTKNPWDRT